MYGKALAKSAEHLAANHLARSVTEGLIANGFVWLKETPPAPFDYTMQRSVRGHKADILYNVAYEAAFNDGGLPASHWFLSKDVCRLTVSVRWNSASAGKPSTDGLYNNVINYTSYVYKGAIN